MTETPLIRRAIRADVAAIQAMLQEQADHHGEALQAGPEALERYGFGAFSLFRCLIAERGAETLGFALYYPISRRCAAGPASCCKTSSSGPRPAVWAWAARFWPR